MEPMLQDQDPLFADDITTSNPVNLFCLA